MDASKEENYYVVELMDPSPQMVVEQYVCVPNNWLVLRDARELADIAAVKYPNENASVTKQRVEKREAYSDKWMIFVANVKYGTDSYKDAMDYIEILNKISNQERDSEMNDSKTSQAQAVCSIKSNFNITESELISSANSDVTDCKNQTNVETVNSANKRYFTRQSRKMYTTDKLSEAINDISLDTSVKAPMESDVSKDEDTGAKNDENTDLTENNNQKSQNASLRHEFINEQLVECIETIKRVSSISELALEEHDVLKRLEDITISIKQSIGEYGTQDPSKIKIPVFGANFIGLMQKIYSQFDQCQAILYNAHRQYIENCLTIKKIIDLVNALNAINIDSNDKAEKEVVNIVEEKTNENVEVISDTENDIEERPQGAQIQSIINTVVQKSFDATDKNINTDDQKSNEIRSEPPKFTLPPEYDSDDPKWSRKYRDMQSGLEEIVPNSGVYVNSIRLANCLRVAKDSKTLARMLMLEIFSENALKTCSLTGKRANAFYSRDDGNVRPGLDQHARMVLMNYVDDHAKKNNWIPINTQAIVDSMRNKLQEMRVKSSQRKIR